MQHPFLPFLRSVISIRKLIDRRCIRDPCQHCCFSCRQIRRIFPVVMPGSFFKTIASVSVIIHIRIDRKQILFGKREFQPVHQEHFCSFLLQSPLFALEIEILGNLLRDRASAFHDSSRLQIMQHCPEERQPVKPMPHEESLVFRRNDRMHEVFVNVLERKAMFKNLFRKRFRCLFPDGFMIKGGTWQDSDQSCQRACKQKNEKEGTETLLHSRLRRRSRISQVITP